MNVLTGQFERTIDAKHRLQLPTQLRDNLNLDSEGSGLYVTLGERAKTLSIYTANAFNELADRLGTEFEDNEEANRFELQFYALASFVELDKQGRVLLPERLLQKARLKADVVLVGQRQRIDVWRPGDLEVALGIDWADDEWPQWHSFLRRRPKNRVRARNHDFDRDDD